MSFIDERWSLLEKIKQVITKEDSRVVQACDDFLSTAKELMPLQRKEAVKELKWLSCHCENLIPRLITSRLNEARDLLDIHKDILQALAVDDFDSFLQFVEWNREPRKRFYLPRRKILRQVVDALQDLADLNIDLLAISLPPGVGKTTLAIFFLIWMAGKYPDAPMLTGSHSNAFVRGVYDECLRMLDPQGEYLWNEVFPGVSISGTNAKDCRIDIGTRKRFETLEFTSIGSGNAGLYRAATLLYCDDLVSGIEIALSKERLEKLWQTYTTDLRQRKIGDHCRELHIATRWSVHDVIGKLEEEYGNSERARFIVIPALDDNDRSNFDYPYGVGFTSQAYRDQRDIMDEASWKALYMNEPIEREGLVFDRDELKRYLELPDREPDAIVAVCDTKDKGKDYCVMPVAYVYGKEYYIEDCVCDNSMPEVVEAKLAQMLLQHKVKTARFESNSAGGRIAKDVHKEVLKRGGFTEVLTKYTTANKETKIIVNSGWVKQFCHFKDDSLFKRKSDYGKFMDMLCSYTSMGKNMHDDVPDAMAQLAEFAQKLVKAELKVFKRPF